MVNRITAPLHAVIGIGPKVFIFQAQTPDGCFDYFNYVGKWVNSGRRQNGDFGFACAVLLLGPSICVLSWEMI